MLEQQQHKAVIKIIIRGSSENSESSCARVNDDDEGANLFAFTFTSATAAVQFVNSIGTDEKGRKRAAAAAAAAERERVHTVADIDTGGGRQLYFSAPFFLPFFRLLLLYSQRLKGKEKGK